MFSMYLSLTLTLRLYAGKELSFAQKTIEKAVTPRLKKVTRSQSRPGHHVLPGDLRRGSDPQYYDDRREMPSSQLRQMSISHIPTERPWCEALSAIDLSPRSSPSAERAYSFQGFQGLKTTRPRQAPFSSALSYNESSPQRTFPRLAAAGKADGLIMLAPTSESKEGSPAGPQA